MRLNQVSDEGKVDQEMKKLHAVLMALVAVFALSAVAVSTASAEITLLAEWLANGNPITMTLATTSKGTLLLTDSATPLGSATVKCAGGSLDGWVGPDGTDQINEVLTSTGKSTEAGLKGEGFLCEGTKTCEKDATETEAWPIALPIMTLLYLLESTTEPFTILFFTPGAKNVGWEIKCLALATLIEDTCSGEDISAEALNGSNGSPELMGPSSPGESCTEGSSTSGTAETEAGNTTTLNNGETLTMSSEGIEG
jgi:hypothetical protein